jgi:hypothetical protein
MGCSEIGPMGARARRFGAMIVATVVLGSVFVGAAALRPSRAEAWAWKDTCTIFVFNKTGAQTNVRPILYTPVMPNPASIAQYVTFAAIGVPTQGAGAVLTNTGIPLTWGCHTFINFANPGPSVHCEISAPTKGANTFSCGGNSTVRIIKDDDDIAGNVFIPSGSGDTVGKAPSSTRPPATGPAALRSSELPGGGWRTAKKGLDDLGVVGKLMNVNTLSSSCKAGGGPSETAPTTTSSGLYTRHAGGQWIGAASATFATAAQARATLAEALSSSSLRCLRGLLTSTRLRTSTSNSLLLTGGLGSSVRATRLAVRQGLGGRRSRTHYLDVVGAAKGRRMALVMLASSGTPTSATLERAAVRAALRRIGA